MDKTGYTKKGKKKNSKKRAIIGTLAFMVCAGIVFCYLNKVFSMGDSDANRQTFKGFYAEEENTIDAIYFGTSASNRYFINPLAYEKEGISCYTVATMGMPMFFVPDLMNEVQKTQDPKLYIIELRWVMKDRDLITDAHIRRVVDNLKLSPTKYSALDTAMEYMDGNTGMLGDISYNKIEYFIPLIKYHGRFEDEKMTRGDFKLTSTKNETKGYTMTASTTKQVNQFPGDITENRTPLSDIASDALNDTLDACDKLDEDTQVLFVLSPYSCNKDQKSIFNTAMDMVKDRGYEVIDFNTSEMYANLNLDFDKDYYNSKHVNYIGAEKYTNYLTEYLTENYNLPNHKGESGYESWDKAYEIYQDYVEDGIDTIGVKEYRGGPVTIIKYKGIVLEEQNNDK